MFSRAWYKNRKLESHLVVYKNSREANRGIGRMSNYGWVPVDVTSERPHANLRKTLLLAPVRWPLLFGLARSGGRVHVLYARRRVDGRRTA